MTHEEFKQLKPGDKVYVPFIEKYAEISTGTSVLGSDSFEKYTVRKLTVLDSAIHDYDPDHTHTGWWNENLVVQFVRFDISQLAEKEQENFNLTYSQYFPVFCKCLEDEVKQYKGCFEVPYNKELTEDNSYEGRAISFLHKKKTQALKTVRQLNRQNLQRIDNIIKFYKKTVRPEVKKFIRET